MTPLWPLFLTYIIGLGVDIIAARQAWPLFRRMEREGILKKPVPDLLEGNTNAWRTTVLVWATPVPAERKRLRRWLLICRTAQITWVASILSILVIGITRPPSMSPESSSASPAGDVRLEIGSQ